MNRTAFRRIGLLSTVAALLLFTGAGAAKAADNLIPNPSLEVSSNSDPNTPSGWHPGNWGSNTAAFTYPVAGYDGARAARVQLSNRTSGDAKWYMDPVSVTPGAIYTFTDNYLSSVSTFITLEWHMNNGTLTYVDVANPAASTAWAQASATFTAPANAASVVVFHLINSNGSLTVDNYSLSLATVPTPAPNLIPADPSNLIPNQSLQSSASDPATPANWGRGTWGAHQTSFGYPIFGYNGGGGLKTQITSYSSGDSKWYFNPINVTGGETYVYSDYYMSNVPSHLTVQFGMSNGSFTYVDVGGALSPASSWTQSSATISVPAGAQNMTVFHLINQIGSLSTSAFTLKKGVTNGAASFDQGMVTLTFDDGYETIYRNAKPILDQAGYKATLFMVSGFVDDPDQFYMSRDQMLQFSRSGYEIGAHTRTHPSLVALSQAQMQSEIAGSGSDLLAMGVPSVTTFSYPFGDYNDQVVQIVKQSGYVGARSVVSGFNTKNSDKYLMQDQHVTSDVTPVQIRSWIDQALADKTWLILEMHRQEATEDIYSNTPQTLQAIVNYLQQKNAKVVTFSEGLNLMNP